MPKTKVKTEVENKIQTTAAELRVDDTVTNAEVEKAAEASRLAAEAKADYDAQVAAKTAAMKGIQVDGKQVQAVFRGETKELIKAVQEDAAKRGKTFSVCPISGVLVVA